MTLDRRTREQMLAHCGAIHEDDGVDPRQFFKTGRINKKDDRKARQLCRQVAETLDQLLTGEVRDDVLRGLHVVSVVPAPDASRLLVTLQADGEPEELDPSLVESRLAVCRGHLRCEVAAAITRRKTPVLVFSVIGPDSTCDVFEKEVNL